MDLPPVFQGSNEDAFILNIGNVQQKKTKIEYNPFPGSSLQLQPNIQNFPTFEKW